MNDMQNDFVAPKTGNRSPGEYYRKVLAELKEKRNSEGGLIMDYHQMTVPCGLDCFNCTFYLAEENTNAKAQIEHMITTIKGSAI